MASSLGQYEAEIDMGGGGSVFVRRDEYWWAVDHMDYHQDHPSLIGPKYETWHQALMAAIAYAVEYRKPRP